MHPVSLYVSGLREKFGHFATWLPDEKLRLGDVGVFQKGRFFVQTSLDALKLKPRFRRGHGSESLGHTSGRSVDIGLSTGAADGTATIKFGGAGSFVFQTSDSRTDTIENMADISQEILFLFRANRYEKDWVIIDRLVTTTTATILISSSESAEVTLAANAPLNSVPALADGSIKVHVTHSRGEVTQYVASSGLTPLFGASRLRRSLLQGLRIDPMRSDTDSEPPSNADSPLEDIIDDERFALQGAPA